MSEPSSWQTREPALVRASEVLESHRLSIAGLSELLEAPRIDSVFRWLERVAKTEHQRLAGLWSRAAANPASTAPAPPDARASLTTVSRGR